MRTVYYTEIEFKNGTVAQFSGGHETPFAHKFAGKGDYARIVVKNTRGRVMAELWL